MKEEKHIVECAQCFNAWIATFEDGWISGIIQCNKCNHYGEPMYSIRIQPKLSRNEI